MYRLYCFQPGKGLIRAIPLFNEGDIKASRKWIQAFQAAEGVSLIRAILGPTELVILEPDDELRMPEMYAKPTGKCRR